MNTSHLKVKDPGSALTHFIAMIGAALAATPLLFKAAHGDNSSYLGAFVVFIVSMICLYGASTIYHTFDISEKVNSILRKIDHAMIFVLIAGSYTPVCLIVLPKSVGLPLLATVWAITIAGIIFKICWINCPHWVSSVMYIGMGWLVVFAFSSIMQNLSRDAFMWLLAGGIIYTIGGIIYALKLPIFKKHNWKNFGNHELFHCFVMLGSLCHFIMVYHYLA
ncbi:MAG: hemolysin III family protein [Lachnospiraceae bacterium]